MELFISVAAADRPKIPEEVIAKIAATIHSSGKSQTTPGIYSKTTCYGAVAHYLKTHVHDPSWTIYLFGGSSPLQHKDVIHAAMYDADDKVIVDTYKERGHFFRTHNKIYYQLHEDDALPELYSITVGELFRRYPG